MKDFSRGRWTSSGFTTRLCLREKFRISRKLVVLKEVSVFIIIGTFFFPLHVVMASYIVVLVFVVGAVVDLFFFCSV